MRPRYKRLKKSQILCLTVYIGSGVYRFFVPRGGLQRGCAPAMLTISILDETHDGGKGGNFRSRTKLMTGEGGAIFHLEQNS